MKRSWTDFTKEEAASLPKLPKCPELREIGWYRGKNDEPRYIESKGAKPAKRVRTKKLCEKHGKRYNECKLCKPKLYRNIQLRQIKRYYQIDEQQYLKLFEDQNYKCGNLACSNAVEPFGKNSCVDHVKRTGVEQKFNEKGYSRHIYHKTPAIILGVLCRKCNSAAGLMRDSPDMLRGLAAFKTSATSLKINSAALYKD